MIGPTIVLMHGAFADGSSWTAVIERLQERGYTVVAPANPLRGVIDDAAYATSVARQIEGPVLLVGHSYGGAVIYRWRLGLAPGDPELDDLERRLAETPPITVPTITLEGDANGAPHPDPGTYASKFIGPYEHRTISGGIGHNFPQEAPQASADAVLAVDTFASEMAR